MHTKFAVWAHKVNLIVSAQQLRRRLIAPSEQLRTVLSRLQYPHSCSGFQSWLTVKDRGDCQGSQLSIRQDE